MWQYLLRSIKARIIENTAVVSVIAVVVSTCILILAFADNMRQMEVSTGDPENVIVLSKGAVSESTSSLGKESFDQLRVLSGVKVENGVTLVSAELLSLTTVAPKQGPATFVTVRGVDPATYQVRRKVHIESGRLPQPGTEEVIVGKKLEGLTSDFKVGGNWGKRPIVGVFTADGSLLESELWMDRHQLALTLGRKVGEPISVVVLRSSSPADAQHIIDVDVVKPSIALWAMTEPTFYQTFGGDSGALVKLAIAFSLVLGLGAGLAATNALYSSMLGRSSEFATLYAIGVRRSRLGMLVLKESIILALVGAVVGSLLALAFNGQEIARLWTDDPFEHFPIHVGLMTLAKGSFVGLAVGLLGGLVPAFAVRRMDMLRALG